MTPVPVGAADVSRAGACADTATETTDRPTATRHSTARAICVLRRQDRLEGRDGQDLFPPPRAFLPIQPLPPYLPDLPYLPYCWSNLRPAFS